MAEEVVGFTAKQREWVKNRDNNQCMHRTFVGGRWVRCTVKLGLQVHHIIPRGWCRLHLNHGFQVNGSMNAITLCEFHHVGKDSVHPDTYHARNAYQAGDKDAFKKMMAKRKELNEQGIPYWNTQHDWQYQRLVKRANGKYARNNPYPVNGNRGNTGRLKDDKAKRKPQARQTESA